MARFVHKFWTCTTGISKVLLTCLLNGVITWLGYVMVLVAEMLNLKYFRIKELPSSNRKSTVIIMFT